MAAGILAGENRGPIGRTQRCRVKGVGKQRALMRQAVNVRGLHVWMTTGTEFVEAQVVDQDHDQVGTQRHGSPLTVALDTWRQVERNDGSLSACLRSARRPKFVASRYVRTVRRARP